MAFDRDAAGVLGGRAGGIGIGWYVYGMGRVDTAAVRRRLGFVYTAMENKFYMDDLYRVVFIQPFFKAADALSRFDSSVIDGVVNSAADLWQRASAWGRSFDINVIDGAVNGAGTWIVTVGSRLRRVQTGRVQSYQKLILGALLLLLVLVLLKGA